MIGIMIDLLVEDCNREPLIVPHDLALDTSGICEPVYDQAATAEQIVHRL